MRILFSIIVCALLSAACTNESASDLAADYVPLPEVVTYTGQVKPIIETNCLFCHTDPPQNGAPMRLTTYEDVKNAVANRGLIDRISRDQGEPGMMPLGMQRLPQNDISLIEQWNADGLQQ